MCPTIGTFDSIGVRLGPDCQSAGRGIRSGNRDGPRACRQRTEEAPPTRLVVRARRDHRRGRCRSPLSVPFRLLARRRLHDGARDGRRLDRRGFGDRNASAAHPGRHLQRIVGRGAIRCGGRESAGQAGRRAGQARYIQARSADRTCRGLVQGSLGRRRNRADHAQGKRAGAGAGERTDAEGHGDPAGAGIRNRRA